MNSKNDRNRIFTTHQVAQMLGVSDQSVANWVDAGLLVASRTPGGHRRIQRADLVTFLRDKGVPVPVELLPTSMTILVVDDEPEVGELVASLLRRAFPDYNVATATDGFGAGRLVSELHPDVVVLDLYMPGLDGFEVCRRIKMDPRTMDIKVVAMTAHYTDDAVAAVTEAGAEICLAKPIDGTKMSELIGGLLAGVH